MLRNVSAVIALLTLGHFALADYLLLKIDINQVPFSALGTPDSKGMGPMGIPMPMPMPMPNPMGLPMGNTGVKEEENAHWIYGVIEFKRGVPPAVFGTKTQKYFDAEHKWGKHAIIPWIPYLDFKHLKNDSALEEFRTRKRKQWGDGKDVQMLERLTLSALTHGLPKEFHGMMEELKKAAPQKPAVLAYQKLQNDLKKPPTTDDPLQAALLADLRGENYKRHLSDDGHYAIYCKDGPDFNDASLKRRKARLEDTFANFFYWIALQERADIPVPPLPPYRLSVLIEPPGEFYKRQREGGLAHIQTDGFTLRRENLIVLSTKPVDESYLYVERSLLPVRQQLILYPDQMLKGTELWARLDVRKNFLNTSIIQSLTLLQKIREDEAEHAAISREAVRQLLGATGILSRNVEAPEWVQAGISTYFECPPGSLHTNFGLASTTNLLAFKHLRKTGKLGKSSDVLLNLATDFYFRQAHNDLQRFREADKNELPKKQRDALLAKVKESEDLAESTAWSFVFHLALHGKSGHLLRYLHQLNEMPRNMKLNDATLQACFAKAFALEDAKDPRRLDPTKAHAFAETWFSDMEAVPLEHPEVEAFRERRTTK